jgi:hypothetical protein
LALQSLADYNERSGANSAAHQDKIASSPLAKGLALALASGSMMFASRGLQIDDAFIPASYARSLANGDGYRLTATSAVSDGVTPLPWVFWLAACSKLGFNAWVAARISGALALILATAFYAFRSRLRAEGVLALLVLGVLPAPLSVHASTGLETSACTALLFFALGSRGKARLPLLSLVPTLRPELLPAVATFAALPLLSLCLAKRTNRAVKLLMPTCFHMFLLAVPFAALCMLRQAWFGDPLPLSFYAKPGTILPGVAYTLVGTLLIGALPAVLTLPWGHQRLRLVPYGLGLAAVAFVGGDWMPQFRLLVPLSAIMVDYACRLTTRRWGREPIQREHRRRAVALKATLALSFIATLYSWSVVRRTDILGGEARYQKLAKSAAPWLGNHVASLDVGWLAWHHPQIKIFDLAGVTDRDVAHLPGGHTSKHIELTTLHARGVDTLLVYESRTRARLAGETSVDAFEQAVFPRALDRKLARQSADAFEPWSFVPLSDSTRYWVLRRIPQR